MIRFANIEFLWLLLGIPVFLFLAMRFLRGKRLKRAEFVDAPLHSIVIPQLSQMKPLIKILLLTAAYFLIIVVMARPQFGKKLKEVKTEGADIIIALDVSKSMLAEDIKPNRLERSKLAINNLIDKLRGDRIGLVIFAAYAYTQLPITSDYAAAKMLVSTVTTDMVPSQGTSIADAIYTAGQSLINSSEGGGKVIIIISDGEDHEQGAIEAAKEMKAAGIKIHTIGVGSPAGVPIPIYKNGIFQGYKTDNQGITVVTKLNEKILQDIARETGGVYIKGNKPGQALTQILEEIKSLDKKESESLLYADFDDKYQWFLLPFVILLIIELLLTTRKSVWLQKLKLFE